MNLAEIEQNVARLDTSQRFDLVYDLLRAYGIPKASISRLKSGTYDRSKDENEHLWKAKLYYRYVDDGQDLHLLIDNAKSDNRIMRERPRFLIVRNDERLVAIDTKVESTLDIALTELSVNAAFFLPWAGIEKTRLESLNYADIKAAEKMARLYDEIVKHNEISTAEDVHDLNVFFSRLLFCFFAEDTGVFPKGSFTNALASLTQPSGEDTNRFLDGLFEVLDTPLKARQDLAAHLVEFGYVNGKLFARRSWAPRFSATARRLILECGTLDWSQINPDIFGSMIQAVVHPSQREGLGMHYTSVENIMKVIRPLFLDELQEAYAEAISDVPRLERLLARICAIKVFDPACGSGNFLVISYKELRKLEHLILRRIGELEPSKVGMFKLSGIKLENFYGIEIDDFAHEIAILSLWLAKHQMNVEFHQLFGVEISLIPLKDTGNIVCANATRISWEGVCPRTKGSEIYLLGNPPYLGSSMQTSQQKEDFVRFFGSSKYPKNLDYISLWFLKGADYIENGDAHLGFVSTNSICQGDHVGLLWPRILNNDVQIAFAHTSFPWTNLARGKAGVICVIVGLSSRPRSPRRLYSGHVKQDVENINPYLAATARNTIVMPRRHSISGLPSMVRGNQPTDGGLLNFTAAEMDDFLAQEPLAAEFVRPYTGAEEFINGKVRFCLWIDDDRAAFAASLPTLRVRLEKIRRFRLGRTATAQGMADQPHRFMQRPYRNAEQIIVPRVSSERRFYIPMGFLDSRTIVSDLANAIYGAELWVFGLIQSRMHMVWVRTVAGRLKSDIRYSPVLCYNTFPVPEMTHEAGQKLETLVLKVLAVREEFADKTLADLYDSEKMPRRLRDVHERLDRFVEKLYRSSPFESDDERLDCLFHMYEALIASENRDLQNA